MVPSYSVAERHRCDFFVPVSSPVSAVSDSKAKPLLEELGCRVLHFDLDECLRLDDKHEFGLWARELRLPSLDSRPVPTEDAARSLNRQLQGSFRPNEKTIDQKKCNFCPNPSPTIKYWTKFSGLNQAVANIRSFTN